MHTILGAGGPVSNALTKELLTNGNTVKLVSRKPVTIFSGAQWVQADLKDRRQVLASVKGSSVIYITAGLTYNRKIWAAEWPLIMENLLAAAKETGARLIFFDNVYMYGRVKGAMTEQTPYNPSSVKGEIRARIAERLMEESKRGNINATIARGADFYGTLSLTPWCCRNWQKRKKPCGWVIHRLGTPLPTYPMRERPCTCLDKHLHPGDRYGICPLHLRLQAGSSLK
jgi:nucleoside-diphosphate-sugar epimerase